MACDRRNPLQRSGTHQTGRVPAALAPETFGLDERSMADLLRFGALYSRELKYYDSDGNEAGDWATFFTRDPAAVLAGASLIPVSAFNAFELSLRHFIDQDLAGEYADNPLHRQEYGKLLFWLPVLLISQLLEVSQRLGAKHHFARLLKEAFEKNRDSLLWLVRAYKGASDTGVVPDAAIDFDQLISQAGPGQKRRPLVPSAVFDAFPADRKKLSEHVMDGWALTGYAEAGWDSLVAAAVADPTPFLVQGPNLDLDGLQSLLRYNLFNRAYRRLMGLLARLADQASQLLDTSLGEQNHEAHYGLYIAFLRLFQDNQKELNRLPDRHLKYYYQDVLRIPREPGRGDRVNVAVGLKKNARPVLLKKGTALRAGKDAQGGALFFGLEHDFVPNQSKLESLQSLFLGRKPDSNMALPFAASVTNSLDGLGEALPKDQPGWAAFGPFAGKAMGRLGFALADRRLFLREGKRTITVDLHSHQSLPTGSLAGAFRVYLTGEKAWFEAADVTVTRDASQRLRLVVKLSGGDPPIIRYDEKVHASGFAGDEAMMRVELALDTPQGTLAFNKLRHTTLAQIKLRTKAEGLRNFTLQNDFGKVDPAKPFLPFGPMPEKDASLRLGSSEVFSKPLDWIKLDLTWELPYAYDGYFVKAQKSAYKLNVSHLSNGQWQGLPESPVLFKTSGLRIEATTIDAAMGVQIRQAMDQAKPKARGSAKGFEFKAVDGVSYQQLEHQVDKSSLKLAAEVIEELYEADRRRVIKLEELDAVSDAAEQSQTNPPYDAGQQHGFLRFSLTKGFGFRDFQNERTMALIAEANSSPWSYTQKPEYNYDGGIEAHVPYGWQPFWNGGQPKVPYLPKIMELDLDYQTRFTQVQTFIELHPFGWRKGGDHLLPATFNDGELYLGLKDIGPPSKVSLLFRCLEGTSNPLKNPASLTYAYLKGDEWINIESEDVSDSTYSLSSTGIIGLAVPADANTDHHLMASGFYWLRIAAAQDTDAVSHLLEVVPNGTTASRVLDAGSPIYPDQPLPEVTISKLKDSVVEVKALVQPDASFDGRPPERDDTYYRRVAERLRHKDRGVTMWDYEHLVLERFPEIYKVKCLNHTRLERDTDNNIVADNEVRPGSVVVVPLPYVRATSDQRRPYARKRTLLEISDYLKTKVSPFVRLEVQNPKVEEVQMKFGVAFTEDIDDVGFYLDLLNQEIVRFLTPWMYEQGREVEFGGNWAKSTVIAFVERLGFVDYLKDVRMYHRRELDDYSVPADSSDLDMVHASTGRSVLVSHAHHLITDIRT